MKTADGYRFTLQFSAASDAYIRAGEMLERMKHKKSDLVVRAICEYLDHHPEIEAGEPVRLEVKKELFRRDELEDIVRSVLQEHIGHGPVPNAAQAPAPITAPGVKEVSAAVSMMLDGLDDFI